MLQSPQEIFNAVIATTLLMLLLVTIILIATAQYFKKQRAFQEIEDLFKKQELKTTYSLIEGQEQERKRIATDIHDNVGNLMATLKIYSDLVLKKEQDAELTRLNEKINQIIETVTVEIRKISHSLDSGVVQNFGLKAAIGQLSEAVQDSGKIDFVSIFEVTKPLSSDTSLHLYRIVQELVTNTLKHAQATKARLEISQVGNGLSIIFEDNGIGFAAEPNAKPGIGLQNIRSRVSHLQGDLSIKPSSLGSTFIIELPNV